MNNITYKSVQPNYNKVLVPLVTNGKLHQSYYSIETQELSHLSIYYNIYHEDDMHILKNCAISEISIIII